MATTRGPYLSPPDDLAWRVRRDTVDSRALYARAALSDDLPWLLVGDDGWKATVTDWLDQAYVMRFLIVAVALSVAALLTEGIRRLPRALRSALWLLRTTRLAPLDGGWRVGVVAAVAVVGLGALLTAVSISDWVRTVMGVAAGAFILFPRQ